MDRVRPDAKERKMSYASKSLRLLLAGGVAIAALVGALALSASPAPAAKGGTCEAFTVVVNGQAFSGDQKRTINGPINSIAVRGTYIRFRVNPNTFAVRDYTHTGVDSPRADKNLPINAPTVIFERKVPNHGDVLTGPMALELGAESVVLERAGSSQDMKIQAKDCQQGGLFQMEPEPGTTETNTLGPGFRYTQQPPGEERLCFTNGRFSGYDSPELATLVSNTATTARWRVQSGGRIGMVIGEDAVEGGCRP
jgi:hypothetical protein